MRNGSMPRSLMGLVLILVLVATGFGPAAAYAQGKDQLPTFRQPASARFDIEGNLTSSSVSSSIEGSAQSVSITGSGAISGNDFEETISYVSLDQAPAGSPSTSFTVEAKKVGTKVYIKMGGLLGQDPDQWYVMDATGPLATSSPIGDLSALGSNYTVVNEGQETINGVSTTRYKLTPDLDELLGDLGGSTSGNNSYSMAVYMWVGDQDQYLHKYSMDLDFHSSFDLDAESRFELNLSMDLSITLKDFDMPVTITAPVGAVTLDMNTNPNMAGFGSLAGGLSVGVAGMPMGMPAGMPSLAPPAAPAPSSPPMAPPSSVGMPRTGEGEQNNAWALTALAVGTLCLGLGIRFSRRETAKAEIK